MTGIRVLIVRIDRGAGGYVDGTAAWDNDADALWDFRTLDGDEMDFPRGSRIAVLLDEEGEPFAFETGGTGAFG